MEKGAVVFQKITLGFLQRVRFKRLKVRVSMTSQKEGSAWNPDGGQSEVNRWAGREGKLMPCSITKR